MGQRQGKADVLVLALDVIGFALVFLGAAFVRFSREEITSILGGFVMAGGVALLSITRMVRR